MLVDLSAIEPRPLGSSLPDPFNMCFPHEEKEHPSIYPQIQKLLRLEDGWLDGEGIAPGVEELDGFYESISRFYSENLPYPFIYPTLEGDIQIEWEKMSLFELISIDISCYINLKKHTGDFHILVTDTSGADNVSECFIDLDKKEGWVHFIDLIKNCGCQFTINK